MRLSAYHRHVMLLILWLALLGACAAPPSGQHAVPQQQGQTPKPIPELDALPEPAPAGGLAQRPLLRLNTGTHTAAILKLGVDAANRYLATGSLDKTIRVWELATGRLLRTLRPPIGLGDEGSIYALALSPDGTTVAAGGATGHAWDAAYAIYLFDRASGKLRQRLTGLPETIQHLAYSRDGAFLAVTLRRQGMRVYRTQDYTQVASDSAYGDRSTWADFDGRGRLVTSTLDGVIRLYDRTWQVRAKHQVPQGFLPYSVAFTPDGARVAVGFSNALRVQVLAGTDLAPVHTVVAEPGNENQHVSRVAWAADGKTLFAGGWHPGTQGNPIRRWAEQGHGTQSSFFVAQHGIAQLLPLTDGRLLFATFDAALSMLDSQGQRQPFQEPTHVDFRTDFRLSPDGATVQFRYKPAGGTLARFSLQNRGLVSQPAPDASLVSASTAAPGLDITGWHNTYTPAVNGTVLKLWPYEIARSLAIAPDQKRFLLGADWSVRLFERSGKQLWRVSAPGTAWRVHIAGNGEVAVAAFGDGTIRWYRLRDGQELLAFFPHADRKRWVLWTPSGYYDASPGAEELIGWHVNRGRDQEADFFPVARFRKVFFRPDVVANVLQTRDEAVALRQASAALPRAVQEVDVTKLLPPVVQIQSPAEGTTVTTPTLTVRVKVRTPSGEPVTALKGLIDGRPVAQTRGLQVTEAGNELLELQMTVPPHDCEVAIVAENRHAVSAPATLRLRWGGAATAELVGKPKLYVLAVGVSRYRNANLTLGLAAKDAQDFAAAMQRQQGRMYRSVEVRQLSNAAATKHAILEGFTWLERQVTKGDVAAIFLAGHGVNEPNGAYYFLPADVDTDRVQATGVVFTDFRNTVAALRGRVLLFVDTCHAGNILWKKGHGTLSVTGVVNELASTENGAVVFAAATGNQVSQENPAWGNGAFTRALVEGLGGKAASPGTGRITFLRLGEYISERVESLTQGQQTPTLTPSPNIPNFPVALAQ